MITGRREPPGPGQGALAGVAGGFPGGAGLRTSPSNAEGCGLHSWSGSQVTPGSGPKNRALAAEAESTQVQRTLKTVASGKS